MDPPLDWASWFAVALPVSIISIFLIWLLLLVSYRPSRSPDGEGEIEIRTIRPVREAFTVKQYWVTFVCLVTIALWCIEHEIEDFIGDMGVIAIIPIVAFFATGVLKKVSFWLARNCPTESRDRMISNSLRGLSFFWPWAELPLEKASHPAASSIKWMVLSMLSWTGDPCTRLSLCFHRLSWFVPCDHPPKKLTFTD